MASERARMRSSGRAYIAGAYRLLATQHSDHLEEEAAGRLDGVWP